MTRRGVDGKLHDVDMKSATRDARWRRRRVDGARAREVSLFNVFFI